MLGRHMDALHTYLAEQQAPVGSLGLSAPGGRGGEGSGDQGLGRQMSQDMGQGQGASGQQQARAEAGIAPAQVAGLEPASGAGRLDGTHISLMA